MLRNIISHVHVSYRLQWRMEPQHPVIFPGQRCGQGSLESLATTAVVDHDAILWVVFELDVSIHYVIFI